MKTNKLLKSIVLILPVLIALLADSCYYFRIHNSQEPQNAVIQKSSDEQKYLILHLGEKAWHLSDITVQKDTIYGNAVPLQGHEYYRTADHDKPNRYRNTTINNQSEVLNEVHIFTSELVNTGAVNVAIPEKAITRIDIYDKASGATVASWTFSILGAVAGVAGIVTGIVFLLKESCPFIYVYDGADFCFTGEIFSGAVQPGLERDDYLLLKGIKPSEGLYKIKMTNEVHERQSVNLAELWIYDYHDDANLLTDKNGRGYMLENTVPPVKATGNGNMDILPLVIKKDSVSYLGNEQGTDKDGIENIILEFRKPSDISSSKLIIRAKNSFWLDGLILKIHRMFGERYSVYSSKQEAKPGEKLRKWSLEQKMPLSVYVEKDNKWVFVDYFNLAGPMTMKDDIIPVDLENTGPGTVRIKLETGFLFWEIDYAAMDFGQGEPMVPVKIPLNTATGKQGGDVRGLMLAPDDSYFVLGDIGDESLLTFSVPEQKEAFRTVYLHSRGFYKILRDQSGEPDKKRLKTFRKPGMVPAFSKEMFDSLSNN